MTDSEVDSIEFCGGEPTMRSDFIQIIDRARHMSFRRIKVLTNGRIFSDMQMVIKSIEAGCYLFEIKIWGSNPDIHDYITQTKGSFWQTIQGLKNLQRLPIDKFICIRIPICRQNYMDLQNIIATIIPYKINRLILSFKDSSLPIRHALSYIEKSINISILNRVWILTENIPFCVMQGLEHHIHQLYNVDKTPYEICYEYHENCKVCIYKGVCPGVDSQYLKNFGYQEFSPVVIESKHVQDIKKLYE